MLPSDRPSNHGDPDPEHERLEFMLRTLDHVFSEYKTQVALGFAESKQGQEELKRQIEKLVEVVQLGQAPLTTRVAVAEDRLNKLSALVYWVAATSVTSTLGFATALVLIFITRSMGR